MSFSDDSLRKKAHLSGVKLPVLVGLTALLVVVLVGIGFMLAHVISSDSFVISKSDESELEENDEEDSDVSQTQQTIIVHIGGAVASPGIQELPDGARVQDAVEAAGGFTSDAARDALNLARVLVDGEQVVIPTDDQVAQNAASGEASEPSISNSANGIASGDSATLAGNRININSASETELETLPGIGPSTASKIINDREANGPFSSIEDIKRVSGIGDKKFAALEDLICVG